MLWKQSVTTHLHPEGVVQQEVVGFDVSVQNGRAGAVAVHKTTGSIPCHLHQARPLQTRGACKHAGPQVIIKGRPSHKQGTSQVLRLSTGFPYNVLSLSTVTKHLQALQASSLSTTATRRTD
jgi:hypothetical protein